jgi:hypothetical protein
VSSTGAGPDSRRLRGGAGRCLPYGPRRLVQRTHGRTPRSIANWMPIRHHSGKGSPRAPLSASTWTMNACSPCGALRTSLAILGTKWDRLPTICRKSFSGQWLWVMVVNVGYGEYPDIDWVGAEPHVQASRRAGHRQHRVCVFSPSAISLPLHHTTQGPAVGVHLVGGRGARPCCSAWPGHAPGARAAMGGAAGPRVPLLGGAAVGV